MLNRRSFIEKLTRSLILVMLASISGVLVFRESSNDQQACDFDFICKNCKKKQNCTLPEALEYKSEKTS
ncbi:MAG: hypothetical protein DRI95_07040 [Bacteroidetes bacterium]|nr:MAG: hypothetical protein DRI95_07040 [Bacteroidota bacterium]RLD74942.1 MAG: hypothetical protein DRJ07_18970 [Bacteroidota bacterium]